MASTKERKSELPDLRGNIPKFPTGIGGLDQVLDGGFPVGRTTVVGGGPGTGKSLLALEFLYRGALQGQPGVFVTFEERAEDVRLNARSLGWDLEELEQTGRLAVIHADLPRGTFQAGEFNIQGLLAILEGQTKALAAGRLVLDAVDMLMRVFADPRREQEELYTLHDWLRDRQLTTILTVKMSPDGEQKYPFLDFMADCVLHLDQRMLGQVRTRRLRVVKYRGSGFLSNEYPYMISPRGTELAPISSLSLIAAPLGEPLSTGHPGLDKLMAGGYRRASTILVAGSTGTGKTTLVCTFVKAACQRGEKVIYVSFEESQEALFSGMLSPGIDLSPDVQSGRLLVLATMPESAGIEEHLMRIVHRIEEFAPQHIVLDAISACDRMGSGAAAFDFLVRLLSACKQRGITCLFTNQTCERDTFAEISGIGISSLIDAVLLLQYIDVGDEIHRRLLVVKARGSAHSMRHHQMQITDGGIEITATSGHAGHENASGLKRKEAELE